MFRFTIRELLLLMVVVGMGVGWWLDRQNASWITLKAMSHVGQQWAREVGHPVIVTTPEQEHMAGSADLGGS
jgi:hypothetical protein